MDTQYIASYLLGVGLSIYEKDKPETEQPLNMLAATFQLFCATRNIKAEYVAVWGMKSIDAEMTVAQVKELVALSTQKWEKVS